MHLALVVIYVLSNLLHLIAAKCGCEISRPLAPITAICACTLFIAIAAPFWSLELVITCVTGSQS